MMLLDDEEIRGLLDIGELLEALSKGFVALSAGLVQAPKRSELSIADAGHLLIKPSWLPDNFMTVKMVSTYLGNRDKGVPTIQALVALFDPASGTPVALMNGGYVTALRTAACAALSARVLARKNASTLAIIGAGVQGRAHLDALPHVGNFSRVRIASLNFEDAQRLAATVPQARAFESYREAVNCADVVCLCTSSSSPVVQFDWLAPGAHVSSVGYSVPGGELSPEIIKHGKLVVESRLSFEAPPIGCGELSGLDPDLGTELGDLISGKAQGRKSEGELTVFKSMGHAMEDMVAANIIYKKALEKGIGRYAKL